MPGVASHILIADVVADGIELADGEELFRIVQTQRPMFRMGAIAPDMFFFAPDFGPWSVDLLRVVTTIYDDVIKPAKGIVDDIVDPIEEALDAVADELDEATCGLFSALPNEIDQLTADLSGLGMKVFASLASDAVNVFDEMVPPIQKGQDVDGTHPPGSSPQGWFWFDMIHYRHTGDLIGAMWQRAKTDAEKAFVLGWSTHHASDVIGHATVNALVGGPYRSHNQRHHFIENLMDVDLYDRFLDQELIDAGLHLVLPQGESVEREPLLTTLLDAPNDPPAELRPIYAMLDEAIRDTYDRPPRRVDGGYLDVEHLHGAYLYSLVSLRALTSTTIPMPPDPSAEALDAIERAWQEFLETAQHPPQPPALPPNLCVNFWDPSCSFDLKYLGDWVGHLWNGVEWLAEVAAWVAEMLADLVRVLTCTFVAPIKVMIRGLFWTLRSAIHQFESFIREALVLTAIAPPDRLWLRTHPLAIESLSLDDQKAQQASGPFPHRAARTNAGFQSYPATASELDSTLAAPTDQLGDLDNMIAAVVPEPALYADYAGSSSPAITRAIEQGHPDKGFDSIESLSRHIMNALVRDTGEQLPNWNMDADRGYGYLAWTYPNIGDTSGESPFVQDTPVNEHWA